MFLKQQREDKQITRNLNMKELINKIPIGYSEVFYEGKKYSLTRRDFNQGKSTKVFGKELGGTDFISFNFYLTEKGENFKPCEMPEEKVLDFLNKSKQVQTERSQISKSRSPDS